eukprot:8025853-Alexandrium_andersonii.AAC.1
MSASLVGSEMCIRDRRTATLRGLDRIADCTLGTLPRGGPSHGSEQLHARRALAKVNPQGGTR